MRKKIALLIILLSALSISGQNLFEVEKELVGHLEDIRNFSNYGQNADSEKLYKANTVFAEKLFYFIKNCPDTIGSDFTELEKYLHISTSEDGNFRIYSWDTQAGGSMHFFNHVYQFRGLDGNVYATRSDPDEGDSSGFYSDIFTVETKDGTAYLARFTAILSTSLAYQSINSFNIEGNSLNDELKLFKTDDGLQHSIGISYDFFSVVDRPERPIKLILYDRSENAVKVPIVTEDQETPQGRVTDEFVTYTFTGDYFEDKDPGRREDKNETDPILATSRNRTIPLIHCKH